MSKSYTYFTIPFASVPKHPTYTVWYATWSTERPTLELGMSPPLVIGATADGLPPGAIVIADAVKDPTRPPPPPPFSGGGLSDYQKSVNEWVELARDA